MSEETAEQLVDVTEKVKDRITVVETVYHQQFNEPTFTIPSRFSRWLETKEQPYQRRCVATEEWQPLECGWIDKPGMLIITNREGRFAQTLPTDEEKVEVDKKIIQLSYNQLKPEWLIPPGESMRGCPGFVKFLYIRCQSGTAQYELYLLPS